MSEASIASIRELRDHLADVIDRADREDEVTVVTRRGKEVAAVVPIQVYYEHKRWEQERLLALIDERTAASDGTGATLAEVMAEVAERP